MADDVREYLRAAQEAEGRGETQAAIDLLQKAASVYRATGRQSRAIQMLRHALRLDASRSDLLEEIRRLEWLPDTSSLSRAAESSFGEFAERVLEGFDALGASAGIGKLSGAASEEGAEVPEVARANAALLVERGPRWAPEEVDAWCSFCCRPQKESGRLVAGAAGAFICLSCVQFPSGGAGGEAPGEATPPAVLEDSGAHVRAPLSGPRIRFIGEPVRERLPLFHAFKRVLILGPEGSGKSTLLRELAGASGLALRPLHQRARANQSPLYIDDAQTLTPAELAWLEAQPSVSWILAVRGDAPEVAFRLTRDAVSLDVFSSESLVEASVGALPLSLAERIQLTLPLSAPDAALLREVAAAWASEKGLSLEEDALEALSDRAERSPRKGHELAALLDRFPPGDWSVQLPSASRSPRRRAPKKKKDEGA